MAEAVDVQEIRKLPLFSELTDEEIAKVLKLAFVKHYKADSTLFVEGMKGEVLYVVKKGRVAISKKTDQGEVTIAMLGEGEFLGELSLLDEEKRSATARVADESELIVITKKCFHDMLNSTPEISSKLLMHFLRKTASRLRATDKKFEKKQEEA